MQNKHHSCTTGKGFYPELISLLLKSIKDHCKKLETAPQECGQDQVHLEELTRVVLDQLPSFSSLQKVVEAHGWHDKKYGNDETPLDFPALKNSLVMLYYSQVWTEYTMCHRGAGCADETVPKGAGYIEERLAGAFCPNSLYELLARNDDGIRHLHSSATPAKKTTSKSRIGDVDVDADEAPHVVENEILSKPRCMSFAGACMLADISGFTKMSAKFCERGLEGLDDLHHATSGFLDRYVQIVYSRGGDVVAFAGDALVCSFKSKLEEQEAAMRDCCVRAVNCAHALVDVYTEMLTSHVAISCGDMHFSSLGGFKQEWTFLLTGRPIRELSNCIDDSKSRQVVVTAEVYSHLSVVAGEGKVRSTLTEHGNHLVEFCDSLNTILELRNRFARVSRDREVIRSTRQFVPRPVLHAIKYGTLDSISELRAVTTLFLKLDSYDPEKHSDPAALQPFFYMAQQALFSVGGFLRQFLVDDKGCVLIAMWGVPSFTYTNNGGRAVSFALSVRNGTIALGHSCSIGITSGNVYCGNVGSLIRREFVGIGATVNLAARLMGKSKGLIYVDETTYGNIPPALRSHLDRSEGMTLKGYAEPVFAYILKGSEKLDINTRGTVTSAFVQSKVANKVMDVINKVSYPDDAGAQGPIVRFSSLRKIASKDVDDCGEAEAAGKFNLKPLPCPDKPPPSPTGMRSPDSQPRVPALNAFKDTVADATVAPSPRASPRITLEPLSLESKSMPRLGTVAMSEKSPRRPLLLSIEPKAVQVTARCNVQCVVVEAQSGGGKSAIALLFSTYSGKCMMPTYTVKCKSEDKDTPHNVFRKLFKQLCKAPFKEEQQQKDYLEQLVHLCHWPDRPNDELRVGAVAAALGLEWKEPIAKRGDGSLAEFNFFEKDNAVRDIMYLLLGQRPCSIIIEHSHFADAASWGDLLGLMDMPMAVAILITARVGSREEDGGDANTNGSFSEGSIPRTGHRGSKMHKRLNSFTAKYFAQAMDEGPKGPGIDRHGSLLEDESTNRNKLAYDRAHHTASFTELTQHRSTLRLELQPLQKDEIRMLITVDLHWHEDDCSDLLIEDIQGVTFGNAYWCKELTLQFITEKGQDEFLRDPKAALGVVVSAKLSKLTVEQREVLKAGSILGDEFAVEMLMMVLSKEIAQTVIDSLMYLADHNFITRISSDPLVYIFPNRVIRSILCDLSPKSERTKVHLGIAQQVEGLNAHNLEPFYEM